MSQFPQQQSSDFGIVHLNSRRNLNSSYESQLRALATAQFLGQEANQRDRVANNNQALGLLSGARGYNTQEKMFFDTLLQDQSQTPFGQMLESSIQSTIENPEVFSSNQINDFVARSQAGATEAVNDALMLTRSDNAARGVQGGISQANEQQLALESSAEAIQQEGQIRFQAAEAQAENLRLAQQLGVQLNSQNQQARNQQFSILSGFLGQQSAADLELVLGMSEILTERHRDDPDYSPAVATLLELQAQAQELQTRAQQQRQAAESNALIQQLIESINEIGDE